MKRTTPCAAFTIVELLVVVSIIALLIGLLLPAVQKAVDVSRMATSKSNLRQLAAAATQYASEFNNRQFQTTVDDLVAYGSSADEALEALDAMDLTNPPLQLGYTNFGVMYSLSVTASPHLAQPINFDPVTPRGYFRLVNARGFSRYINGRYYDETFIAPKDTIVLEEAENYFDIPGEYPASAQLPGFFPSPKFLSYCFSPAALWHPSIMQGPSQGGFKEPFTVPSAFRAPTHDQALYSDLKTQFMEHHWLQGRGNAGECNPGFTSGSYHDCEPYYFNHGADSSSPLAACFDGHVATMSCGTIVNEHLRLIGQSDEDEGLFLYGGQFPPGDNGYYSDQRYAGSAQLIQAGAGITPDFHIYTRSGIRGRDTLGGVN